MGCFWHSLQGQPSERKVLAATRNSDLFNEQPSTCVQLESVPCAKNGPSEEKTRKRREETQNDGNTVRQRSKTYASTVYWH